MNKSEQTRQRILEAALDLFRQKGFAAATMREVAAAAGMATGAAYYYFASKEAIVLAFYDRAREEMVPLLDQALESNKRLEDRLRAVIAVKVQYFAPNRGFLGALLGSTADPENPLSPFSRQTVGIRDFDIATFHRAIEGSDVTPPKDLAPHLPHMLWMYQMALIFFWLTDISEGQLRTQKLLDKSSRMLVQLLKLAGLPLMRPIRRSVLELVEIVRGR
jgi:AcrR family transcriptional regulator